MRFVDTELCDAWIVEPEPRPDHRGFFARTFCVREFTERGLETNFVQHSVSYSAARGTLRGLHFQRPPHGEVKIVRCLRGAIWDVIVDLRRDSPTYRRWQGFELSADNRRQLYVPRGFAHGFQALTDDTELGYMISAFHAPEAASGLRHDDPAFAIPWPLPVAAISAADLGWPPFAG
ncbi:dTDP-4-dehydrorhamnose 3,5-epimerase [Arenibaculum pallidiluteum]|uniref:dTDP-4-dehydrorhamnose 3,5-epimerase n=1 Tax=Arenibaculum pallidiluteum TaxID=2812559 RepID=UPI001A972DFA|nr:dTDP-4-dehydrorhamnose 3,5-epimerase [Arenibaculum pallidiluteum]